MLVFMLSAKWNRVLTPNCLMGIIFGLSHLACGIYLYFTERKNEA